MASNRGALKAALILSILLCIFNESQSQSDPLLKEKNLIILYEHDRFGGAEVIIRLGMLAPGSCYNLNVYDNRITSMKISRGTCVYVFQFKGCNFSNGRFLTLAANSPCLDNLGFCGYDFNDRMSSIRLC